MKNDKTKKLLIIAFSGVVIIVLAVAVYFLPPINERLAWRLASLRSRVFYFFNPPGDLDFSPAQQDEMQAIVNMTMTAMAQDATATLEPSLTPTLLITPTPTETLIPTPTSTAIPEAVSLAGVRHEFQKMNNCGPATLSMALSYWGWRGDQYLTQSWLRPHPDDRNVMPEEMVAAVKAYTDLDALMRWGGDDEMIKGFIAAGFPVIIERDMSDVHVETNWMGHYSLTTGYDNGRGIYKTQDSYRGPEISHTYADHYRYWRAFNHVYVVIYPPEREAEVLAILGPHADITYNYEHAVQKAQDAIPGLQGRDLFFAWFNLGTSLVNLGDYFGAAQAFDHAYDVVYPTIPDDAKPWRMTWYQTGLYEAFYHTGRYQDVINFATVTIVGTGVEEIEETWYWRGRARLALGDEAGAIDDFRTALRYHPGWEMPKAALRNLGISP